MNKDVIYIEPEDDITDIISKIESSKSKIVALVPPKKAGVFRSIVNIKLIVKAGANAEKTIVLVTTDPSITKLAAATRLPVTKNLQTAPTIPEAADTKEETVVKEEVIETKNKDGEEEVSTKEIEEEIDEKESDDEDEESEEEESEDKPEKSARKRFAKFNKSEKKEKSKEDKKKSNNPVVNWVLDHKKMAIFCGVGGVALILVLIWAFAIAPAAVIKVGIRTTTSNFSENVTFTKNLEEEKVSEGKFYIEEKKLESKSEVEFDATGTKNIGEKATGELIVYNYFSNMGSISINAGSKFTINGLSYLADSNTTLTWDGENSSCENTNVISGGQPHCLITGKIKVTASEPGTAYNIAASAAGWKAISSSVEAYSDSNMAGGTDKNITVVQQSDIDEALKKMESSSEADNKAKLLATISEDSFVIDSSFKQTTGDAVSTPAVGEEVAEGSKAKLSVTTTDTIYVIDKTKMEEFITEKAKLAENYKIYEMNDPFIENFIKMEEGYIGKLKTSYVSGPEVTENGIVEVVRGKGMGTAQHDLKDAFNGISTITIDPSYPWVTSIPNDPNKITVIIDVESSK